ncbi:MAG TPA: cytochrome c oxidase subunit II [Bryobacteraceae bacterium]|nr:cytochrome c oxidase subunit II [Bryobacteraceae bacterium]
MTAALLFLAPSRIAAEYDWLFWILVTICGLVALAIATFIVFSAIRYHRRSENELPPQIRGNIKLELTWTVVPLIIFMGMFAWGATLYFDIERPPGDATEIYVVAKQWMWKLQAPDGRREIDELHVPVGRPVKLIMTSQDVIHSFFVPAFRIKQDVLPNRYTTIWFQPDKPGKYHLFCAEYCGMKHSGMIGYIYAMEPREYSLWLAQGGAEGSLASTGEKLFHQFGCANCHHFDGHGPCPDLKGLYRRQVLITTGATVVADESYIRESIVDPGAKIVAGFTNYMPVFKDRLTEDQLVALIAYIKAIGPEPGTQQPSSAGDVPQGYGAQPGITGPGTPGVSGDQPKAH